MYRLKVTSTENNSSGNGLKYWYRAGHTYTWYLGSQLAGATGFNIGGI